MIKKCVKNAIDDSLKGRNIKIWTGLDVSMRSVESGSMGYVLESLLREFPRWRLKVSIGSAQKSVKRSTKEISDL